MEKEFIIKESILKALIQFLGGKMTYNEVAQIIGVLSQLPESKPEGKKDAP